MSAVDPFEWAPLPGLLGGGGAVEEGEPAFKSPLPPRQAVVAGLPLACTDAALAAVQRAVAREALVLVRAEAVGEDARAL